METTEIYAILLDCTLEAQVKLSWAWQKNDFAFNDALPLTGIKIGMNNLYLDTYTDDTPYSVSELIGLLKFNILNNKKMLMAFNEIVEVDGVYVTSDVVYLCANRIPKEKEESNGTD